MIGIYDSGAGGLSVLKEIKKILPKQDYFFYGDNAHMPFGNKTDSQIISYTYKAMDFFKNKNVDAVVIACNTSSAIALPNLIGYDFPIIGVIDPAVETIRSLNFKKPLLIATTATVNSGAYQEKLKFTNPIIIGNSDLAPAIEKKSSQVEDIIKRELNRVEEDYDGVVLACTHYPLVEDIFKKYVEVPIVNPAKETSNCLYNLLSKDTISTGKSKIYIHGTKDGLREVLIEFLGELKNNLVPPQFP